MDRHQMNIISHMFRQSHAKNTIKNIPQEISQIIFDTCEFIDKIHFKQINKFYYETHHIIDLYNIDNKYICLLTDIILTNFKYINLLNASGNRKITDRGIIGMNLHTLNICFNMNITDRGINGMNLHTLNACISQVTDIGITGMDLHVLDAGYNSKITDQGIKGMNLRILDAAYNIKITK